MQSNFTGRINHSRRANKSSPLNVRQSTPPTPRQQEVWTDSSARFYDDDASYGAYEGVAAAAAAGPLGYLFGALKRVMNHNFKGDETEPAAWSGSEGWTGDARPRDGRKKGSFHSRVL